MTISEDATKNTSVSKAYVKNAQVVVMKADKAGEYTRVEDLSKLTFAAENGSAGEAALKELSYNTTGVTAQSDALMEVASGSTDACVIDITMANATRILRSPASLPARNTVYPSEPVPTWLRSSTKSSTSSSPTEHSTDLPKSIHSLL